MVVVLAHADNSSTGHSSTSDQADNPPAGRNSTSYYCILVSMQGLRRNEGSAPLSYQSPLVCCRLWAVQAPRPEAPDSTSRVLPSPLDNLDSEI